MIDYFPVVIWLQVVDGYGAEDGEPRQSCNDALLSCALYDELENPLVIGKAGPEAIAGTFKVIARKFTESRPKDDPIIPQDRALTLYLQLF